MIDIKNIVQGLKNEFLFRLGFAHAEHIKIWKHRKEICNKCPLNRNGICSKAYFIHVEYFNDREHTQVFHTSLLHWIRGKTPLRFFLETYKRGCNCILRLKQKSDSKCPAHFWTV